MFQMLTTKEDLDFLKYRIRAFFELKNAEASKITKLWSLWFSLVDELAGPSWNGISARDFYCELFVEMLSTRFRYWMPFKKNSLFVHSGDLIRMSNDLLKNYELLKLKESGGFVSPMLHPGLSFLRPTLSDEFPESARHESLLNYLQRLGELLGDGDNLVSPLEISHKDRLVLSAREFAFKVDKNRSSANIVSFTSIVSPTCTALLTIYGLRKNSVDNSTHIEFGFCHPSSTCPALKTSDDDFCEIRFSSSYFFPATVGFALIAAKGKANVAQLDLLYFQLCIQQAKEIFLN